MTTAVITATSGMEEATKDIKQTIIGHPTCQQVQHFIMLQLAGHGEAKRGTSQFRSSSHANAKGEPTGLGLSTHSYKCY
jgi:lipopolysaccharide biosynthesis regulator YciM